jgi:predicted transcriptional regulator
MNTVEINKDKIIKSVVKMLSDKEVVRSYMKGKTSKTTLFKKGIKLAKPL